MHKETATESIDEVDFANRISKVFAGQDGRVLIASTPCERLAHDARQRGRRGGDDGGGGGRISLFIRRFRVDPSDWRENLVRGSESSARGAMTTVSSRFYRLVPRQFAIRYRIPRIILRSRFRAL